MRKFLSLIVMAIAFAIQLPAQTTVTVGNENSMDSDYGPIHSNWEKSFSEVIYLASELQPGVITSISYQYAAESPLNDPSPIIYMAEVSRSSFSSPTDYVTNNLTQVYSGAAVTYNQGWVTITLTTPFTYTGSGNLLVGYLSNRTGYSYGLYFTQTATSDYMMVMNYRDVTDISASNPGDGNNDRYMKRPNTRFTFDPMPEGFCYPAAGAIAQDVLADQATIVWSRTDPSTAAFGLDYKLSSEEEWTTASTSITDTFYTLTALTSLSNYDFRVYAICSEENSGYSSGTFLTPPTENDCLPIPSTETFDDSENMTTWITMSSSPNNWYIGTAENSSTDEEGTPLPGGSLYISSDNGTSASYNNGATTNAYAYAYLSLQEGTNYGVQFDWKGGNDIAGTTIYDYVKVYLVPADYEFPSNTSPEDMYALSDRLGGTTDWAKKGVIISDVETGFYKLVFFWFNDSMDGSAAGCVDNVSLFEISCEPVSSISVDWTNEGESVSADVNVVSENDDVTYILEYRAAADAQWTELTGDSPFSITDLLHGTQYIFRATPVCSGSNYSVISDPVALYSPCTDATIPYYQGFEDAFIEAEGVTSNAVHPLCWFNINGGATGYYFSARDTYDPHSGTGALRYSGIYSTSTTSVISDWMIGPVFNLTGNEQISYKIRVASDYYSEAPKPIIDVMVCDVSESDVTAMADTSRFTLVRSINHSDLGTTYEDGAAILSDYVGAYRIAFAVRNATQAFLMDSVTVDAMPACPPVYDLSAVASSESSIAVTYSTAGIGAAGVTIAYAEATEGTTFDPESSATVTVAQGDDLPVIISDLTPGATYYIAARQSCEGGTYSEAVTAVLPTSVLELPYSQNFDDTEADHGYALSGTGINLWAVGTAANNTTDEAGDLTENGRALYISYDNGANASYNTSSPTTAYAKSPAISFGEGSTFNLSFDYKVGGDYSGYDYLNIYLLPYGAETSNAYLLATKQNESSAWENCAITLSGAYANGIYQLVFVWTNNSYSGSQPGAIVDNIRIETLSCGAVSSIAATLVEPEDEDEALSITVSLTDNNAGIDGVTYVLKYRNTQDSDYTIVSDLSANDFPYTINNVLSSTAYTIAVAAVCPDGVQTTFAQTSLIIPCSVNQVPWEEHFYSDVLNGEPACWTSMYGLLPASGIVQTSSLEDYGNFYYNSDNQCIRANIYSSSFYTFSSWLITPSFDLGDGSTTYGLSFKAKVTAFYGGNAQNAPDDRFVVLVSTDNGLSWDVANALIYTDSDEDTEHNYSDFFNEWSNQVIKLVDENNNPFTGTVKIAFYGESTVENGDNYFFLDDVSITEWNDCINPYNVTAANVTSTTADITFNELGEATSWEYVLVEGANADITSGTPVAFAEADLPLQITGLTPQTTYTLALRGSCGAAFSNWSEAITFTTWAAPTSLPYTTDFETADDNSAWSFVRDNTSNNAWAIGSATFAGEEEEGTSAYISNDNGTSYAATASWAGTFQYMWQDFDFGAGDDIYNLTFDWKCMGYVEGDDLYGGLVVLLQNQSDPMPTDGNFPDQDDIVAMLYGENAWTNAQIELPQVSGEKRLVFFTFGYYEAAEATTPAAIDNISITASTCPAPQNVNVTNITTNSAEISWEGTTTSYVVSYRKVSETTSTDVTVSASPYTLTNLDDATEYIVAVKGICGTDESIYSDAVRFSTYQNSESVPYTCGFDEEGTNGWLLKNGSCTNQWYVANGQMFISQDNGATAGYDVNAAGVIVAEKLFDTGTSDSLTISFDLNIGGESSFDYLKVYWVDADTNYTASTSMPYYAYSSYATNILVSTHSYYPIINLLSGTQTLSVTIPNVANSMKKLVFVWKNDGSDGTQPGAVIDNVSVQQVWAGEPPQPCDAPTALAVNNITQTSADFSWSGTASSYEVRLNGAAAETVTTTSKSFTNLTANTTYTAEVRAMCENNNSAWVSTTFTTLAEQGGVVPPTVATLAATSVTHNSAVLNGTITAGSETITAQGFMYKTTAAATWTSVSASGTTMTATVNGLSAETEYQFKAFATTASGTVEAAAMTFTTTAAPIVAPSVATLTATGVTHEVATLNGTVTIGSEAISAQGFMYKATTAADWTTVAATGETMSATINGLTAETAYEYKAFATTASGTVEGAVVNFTTLAAPATQPTVVTLDATEVTHEAATLNGTIAAGSEAISAQGFMYKATTAADWTTVAAEGTAITATISGLTPETEYEYKAFATTASGTVEGNVVLFTTLANSGLNSAEGAVATMTVYPNPASERATISVSGVESGAKIVVSDMQGRIILSDNMTSDTYELSVANMTSGVYYIRVIGTTSTHTQKLIVE
ncbi:MAG: fibronectin type III domain-containing protein [Bacteroidales bacterium]|nr:fibronectin type III domain-containing protein [Bacteroidales bacterium]